MTYLLIMIMPKKGYRKGVAEVIWSWFGYNSVLMNPRTAPRVEKNLHGAFTLSSEWSIGSIDFWRTS